MHPPPFTEKLREGSSHEENCSHVHTKVTQLECGPNVEETTVATTTLGLAATNGGRWSQIAVFVQHRTVGGQNRSDRKLERNGLQAHLSSSMTGIEISF